VNEIDPGIKDLLERARPARPAAGADWQNVLRRSRRGRGRLFGMPTRGALLLAAALVVALGAVAQAETGVFQLGGRDSASQERRSDLVSQAAYGSIIDGLPRGQVTGISEIPTTTAARVARVFGVPARTYPHRVGVVVMNGPFSIPLYLQGCQATPTICPVPVGHWAWLAYAVLPARKTGALAGLVNARWIRVAPIGTPLPRIARLGHVLRGRDVPTNDGSVVAHQHQGNLSIVARRGVSLTQDSLLCTYSHHRYTPAACGALARYVADLGQAHPDEGVPAAGDFTRVSGDLGGWRGNLVITPTSLGQASAGLRGAVERALGSVHGTPITKAPPGLDCVVNPAPCYRTKLATPDGVLGAINRHGIDLRRIETSEIPTRFTLHLPAHAHITGAATNAGEPAVARRAYMLTIVFDRTIPFSTRLRPERTLGRTWGVFVAGNTLTFFHPYYSPKPIRNIRTLTGRQLRRAFERVEAEERLDNPKDRRGRLVHRFMSELTRTR
jgi:hypothetical protein